MNILVRHAGDIRSRHLLNAVAILLNKVCWIAEKSKRRLLPQNFFRRIEVEDPGIQTWSFAF